MKTMCIACKQLPGGGYCTILPYAEAVKSLSQAMSGDMLTGIVVRCRCADFVLLNKVDLLGAENLDSLSAIVSSLNRLAEVRQADLISFHLISSQLVLVHAVTFIYVI